MVSEDAFCRDFLRRVHPFSVMAEGSLDRLAGGAGVRHLPAWEALPGPVAGVVLRGVLRLEAGGAVVEKCFEGEFFDHGAMSEERFDGLEVRAEEDASILVLHPEALRAVLEVENGPRELLARKAERLGGMLEAVRPRGAGAGVDPFLRLEVGSIPLAPPVFIPADMAAAEAARTMTARGVSACLVGAPDGVAGILTERDIVAQAAQGNLEVPAVRMMTAGLITVRREDLVFEAFSTMVRNGIRRLVVVDGHGRPIGLLQERDMLSARGENPVSLAGDVAAARSIQDLERCTRRLRGVVLRCAAERIGGVNVGRLVAHINDGLLGRAAVLVEDELGRPPCGYALMVLGSEGRREQLLATDQDNALVFAESDPASEAYFEAFGSRFTQILAEAGFPPCPHGVTVANPLWRQSAAAWRDGVNAMMRVVDADAVLRLTQLADARRVHGSARLCDGLRAHVFRQVRDTPVMLKYMAREALRFPPPMGFFHNLVVERSGPAKGCLNVKKGGVFPLTQGLKTLALEHGLRETGTMERLHALRRDGVFSEALAADIQDAFSFFQDLRLGVQAAAVRAGRNPDNNVRPDLLTSPEREKLKNCFRVVIDFQSFLHTKYGLHLIS